MTLKTAIAAMGAAALLFAALGCDADRTSTTSTTAEKDSGGGKLLSKDAGPTTAGTEDSGKAGEEDEGETATNNKDSGQSGEEDQGVAAEDAGDSGQSGEEDQGVAAEDAKDGGEGGVEDDGSCTPECAGRECGPDGCGGVCGECSGSHTCSGDHACICAEGFQDNDEDGSCLPTCASAAPNCHGHGDCDDTGGAAACACVFPWVGEECAECADSYELHTGVCEPIAEYVVKNLAAGGRYQYRPTSPRPDNIRNVVWEGYPFRGVDSSARLETESGFWGELFTYGDQYIIWHQGTWKTCPNVGNCSSFVAGPGPMCPDGAPDAYWQDGFPFCEGIDSMTQIGVSPGSTWVATRGNQYVQWNSQHGYHHWPAGSPVPGPGVIGDPSWGATFPFTEIHAMVDYLDDATGADRILFVSGRQALHCSLQMDCVAAFEMGSAGDSFFPYRWQTLPFARVPSWETPVDSIIRSGKKGRGLFIVSNTPMPRKHTSGELRIYDSVYGPQQRALILSGSAADQGYTQGYLLGEEIVGILNDVIIPFYNNTVVDPVEIAGGKTGYPAVRELVSRFDLEGDFAVYVEELQGMLNGIGHNLATNKLLFDGPSQTEARESRKMDVNDLVAMQLVDDLWGTHCKSAMVWREGFPTVPSPFHISVIDWDSTLGPNNLVVAYDNSDDPERMSWIGPSWSGNIAGFLFGLNEAGAVSSYVSSGGELRRCPEGTGPCLDKRFEDLEGMDLQSTGFVTRRSIELAATVEDAWALLEGVTIMTVASFAMTEPHDTRQSGVIFELVYPGIVDLWGPDPRYTFNPMERPNQLRRFAPDPPGGDFVPVLASVARHLGIVDIPGGPEQPAYVALRDGLSVLYPNDVDTEALIDLVHNEHVYAAQTTQITIGEVVVDDTGNHSVIDVFFSGREGENVWGEKGSHGRYVWSDFLAP